MHEFVMETIEKTLKDWGVDWILEERGSDFKGLMSEIELALGTVID
jgi:hypothetical protein